YLFFFFFFSSRRRHTRFSRDWSSDVCSSDLLRALGVKLAIDDFGTGYSSLSYLHRFPIDTLKIDRSFVTRMSENNENTEIVRTIVVLAQNLGMDVIAEGVETNEQLVILQKLGCENGQGYFFSKPVNSDGAEKIIVKTYGSLTSPLREF